MKNSEPLRALFDQELKLEGGVANLDRHPPELQRLMGDVLLHFRQVLEGTKNSAPPNYVGHNIYLDLVASPQLNAVAFEAKGEEFVGLFEGAIAFVYDAFLSLFSCPLFMPGIGDASQESTAAKELGDWLSRPQITRVHEYRPADPARVEAAQLLTLVAYYFVLAHEIGHITKGHVRFLAKHYGCPKYFDYSEVEGLDSLGRLRQLLEIGADENGAHGSLHSLRPGVSRTVSMEHGKLPLNYHTWSTSIGVVFALFERHHALHGPKLAASHPASDLRYFSVLWSAIEKIREVVPADLGGAIIQMRDATRELDTLFSELGMSVKPYSGAVSSDPGKFFDSEYLERVGDLRRQLRELEEAKVEALAKERSSALRSRDG